MRFLLVAGLALSSYLLTSLPASGQPSPGVQSTPGLPICNSSSPGPCFAPYPQQASPRVEIVCPRQTAPEIPRAALREGISGTVVARIQIQNGLATVVAITGPPVFHAAVAAAVAKYKCTESETPIVATQMFKFEVN